jgi:hypothetical protein
VIFFHHGLVVYRDNTIVVFFSLVLTMPGDELTLEGLTEDVKVTSERLAQLESVQIEVEGRLKSIEDAQDVSNTHLQDILTRLEGLQAAPSVNNSAAARDSTGDHATSRARRVAFGDPQHPATEHGDNYEDYAGDTEDDTTINHNNNNRAHR